jgi:hypothetical protein
VTENTLRASEIAHFVYCHRAWWYARQDYPSTTSNIRQTGVRWHRQQGRAVLAASCIRLLGYTALLGAAVVAAAYLTLRLLG